MPLTETMVLPQAEAVIRPEPFLRLVKHLCAAELGDVANAAWALGLIQLESGIYPRLDAAKRAGCIERVAEFLGLDQPGDLPALREADRLEGLAETAYKLFGRGWRSVTFRTSGSTGPPKRVTLPASMLIEEIAELDTIVPPSRSISAWVPGHNIYGFLFSVLLPSARRAELRDELQAPPTTRVERLRAGDVVIAYPGALNRLAETPARWPADVSSTSAGAPLDADAVRTLFAHGLEAIVEMYGSTETSGVGSRRLDRSTFDPASIKGFTPLSFYRVMRDASGEPTLQRRIVNADGTVTWRVPPIQDSLVWADDGRFTIGPRLDHAVQVAAVNVWPGQVVRVLCGHAAVADAAVRLMRPDEGGAEPRLKAFIVPRSPTADAAALETALRRHCAERLHAEACPARYRFGSALPRTDAGKPADWT